MRLIDADDMLNMVDLLNDRVYSKREIAAMINSRSTAYDTDKVVEELEKASYDNSDWKYSQCEELASYYLLRLKDAIEIVRQGAK